jgi:RNA ligase (TIGR02306 family)
MERKLVTIRKIKEINPIKDADQIEVVTVDGWKVVTKKGEFKVGDECLFFEIDSFLPEVQQFEFIRNGNTFKRMTVEGMEYTGFRLRTVKLRGQISQGLVLPLSLFPEVDFSDKTKDYSEDLGVMKWEAPIPAQLSGTVEGMFPSYVRKTDQERIQNLPEYFEKYKDLEFELTEKLDGSSMTCFWDGEKFGVCSRNLELKDTEGNTLWTVAKRYNLDTRLQEIGKYAIQGELIGEGIQKNPLKIKGQDFYVFDIWSIDEQRYLTRGERTEIVNKLGLNEVPLIRNAKIFQEVKTMDEMLELAKGKSILCNTEREGIVFKSNELVDGNTISFKAINNDYL